MSMAPIEYQVRKSCIKVARQNAIFYTMGVVPMSTPIKFLLKYVHVTGFAKTRNNPAELKFNLYLNIKAIL